MLRKLAALTAIVVVVLIVAVAGVFHYSSSPSFCRNCHLMEPYYQSWSVSKHNDIDCVTCHFEPGVAGTIKGKFQASALLVKYLTKTYSPKPFAKIEDASCLREGCHARDKLGETAPFKGKAAFNHKPHFREDLQSSLTCTSCHSPMDSVTHISVNEQHCYLCHLRDVDVITPEGEKPDKECAVCHRDLPRVIHLGRRNIVHEELSERKIKCTECHGSVVRGRGRVAENTCYNCHEFTERAKTREDVFKLHNIHVKAHVECYLCHDEIKHGIDEKARLAGSDCRSCHMEKHSGVKTLYSGRGGLGAPERPGPMYQAGVDCIGCHDVPEPAPEPDFNGKTLIAVKKRCVECHNDKRYGDILDRWKKLIETRVEQVGAKLKKAEAAMKGKWHETDKKQLFEDARFNYQFVSQSVGIHNVGYSEELLKVAEKKLDTLLGASVKEEGEEAAVSRDVFIFEDTEGLPPAVFNHSAHRARTRDCRACHEELFPMERGATDKLGLMTMSNMSRGKFCGACHNGEDAKSVKEDCAMCHVESSKG